MNTFIELSHPEPEVRAGATLQPLSGEALRSHIRLLRQPKEAGGEALTNNAIANALGVSDTQISQYLSGKYPGDVARLESALRRWLQVRRVETLTGVETIPTDISKLICRKLDEWRAARELGLIIGPAGIGKSRAQDLYLQDDLLAIQFRVCPWHSGMTGLADDLSRAASISRVPRGQRKWDVILEKTTGSGRLLIVDDAHELGPRGLQCCVDWHEKTGNPVALVGLPILKQRLLKDDRRARRVDAVLPLEIKDPSHLVRHLIAELAPDADADRDALASLACQVALRNGGFGAVEKQLKSAARSHRKKPESLWTDLFRAAHTRLLRNYHLN